MGVKLIQVGDFITREFPIEVDEFNIGRDFTCDLRLDHGRVSRNHCRILKRGKRVLVEALYSSAGTAVNQKVLDPNRPPTEVYDGDHLWVGPEHFQFVFTADPHDEEPFPRGHAEPGRPKISSTEIPPNPLLKDITTVQSRAANQLLERLSSTSEASSAPAPPAAEAREEPVSVEGPLEPQGTLDVTQMEGISLVRLLPKSIVADSDIRTITEELDELIDSGRNCITLHLGNVERMSSQVIGEVFQVYKRCKSKGGMLKICRVSPQVAGVFAMTKMERHIEIFPDEKMALKSLWPRPSSSRAAEEKAHPHPAEPRAAAVSPAPPSTRVRLTVEVGRAKGKVVELRGPRFLIGRDQQCQLRPNSNAISRLHTAIEQREGRVFVIDLGSQIGTLLNDRLLHDEEAEAFDGDRLQIEALQFTFAIEAHAEPATPGAKEESSLSGLFGEQSTDSSAATTILPLPDLSGVVAPRTPDPSAVVAPRPPAPLPTETSEDKPKRLRHMVFEVVGDVVVITLLTHDLSDESIISAARVELEFILEHTDPFRYILRFNHVRTVARGTVVMLLARAQHLHQTGGTLRICQVSPPVLEFLEKTQLPQLIDIYSTLDEAMHTPWEPEDEADPDA